MNGSEGIDGLAVRWSWPPVGVDLGLAAAALAAAVPALGLRRTAKELEPLAAPLAARGTAAGLATYLEAIAGRSVREDELRVAEEAFTDHLRGAVRAKRGELVPEGTNG